MAKNTEGVSKPKSKFNELLDANAEIKENSRNLYKTLNSKNKDTLNDILKELKNNQI